MRIVNKISTAGNVSAAQSIPLRNWRVQVTLRSRCDRRTSFCIQMVMVVTGWELFD